MPETSEILVGILQTMASQFAKTVSEIMGGLNSAVSAIAGGLRTAMAAVVDGLTSVTTAIGRGLSSSIGVVTGTITSILGAFGGGLDSASGFITGILSSTVGALGTGLSTAVDVVTTTVGFITGAIGSGFSLAMTLVTDAVGTVTNLVSAGFSDAAGFLSKALGSVLDGVAKAFSGVVSFVAGAITTVVGVLTTAFKGAAEMFSQIATGFVNAVLSSVSALEAFSANVTAVSDQTGMSRDASLGLVNQFNSLGISASKTASIFSGPQFSPQLFNQRAVALGAPKLDAPDFGPALATWFQNMARQGPNGTQVAQANLNSLFAGKASPEILRLANSNPATLAKEAAYGAGVQNQLGINGSVVKIASEELPLLQNRISTFIDAVKMKFAAELLPTLQAGFDLVSKIFLDNSGAIVEVLKNFGHWAFVNMPDLAIQGGQILLNAGKWIADTFFNLADAAIVLLRAFGNQQGPLFSIISAGADFIDFLVAFGAAFKAALAAVATYILDEISVLMHIIPGLSGLVAKYNPQLAAAMSQFTSPVDAFQQTFQASQATVSAHDMLDKTTTGLSNANIAGNFQKDVDASRNSSDSFFTTVQDTAGNAKKVLGSTAQREAEYQQTTIAQNQKVIENTSRIHQVLLDSKGHPLLTGRDVLERMGAYIAQDTARLSRRRG